MKLTDEARNTNIADDHWRMKRDDSLTLDLGKMSEEPKMDMFTLTEK